MALFFMVISHPFNSVSSYLVSLFIQFYLWCCMYKQWHSYWGGSRRKNMWTKFIGLTSQVKSLLALFNIVLEVFKTRLELRFSRYRFVIFTLLKRKVLIRSCVRDRLLFNNTLSFSKSCRRAGDLELYSVKTFFHSRT